MDPENLLRKAVAIADAGATYVKVGLYPHPRRRDCIAALSAIAGQCRLIGVMFADHGADESLIALMAQNQFGGAMVDTFEKERRPLARSFRYCRDRTFCRCGTLAWADSRSCWLTGASRHPAAVTGRAGCPRLPAGALCQ